MNESLSCRSVEIGRNLIVDNDLFGRQTGLIKHTRNVVRCMPSPEIEQFAEGMLPYGKGD